MRWAAGTRRCGASPCVRVCLLASTSRSINSSVTPVDVTQWLLASVWLIVEENMRDESVWVHGSSVRTENPENLESYNTYGWGTDVIFRQRPVTGAPESWFHASI